MTLTRRGLPPAEDLPAREKPIGLWKREVILCAVVAAFWPVSRLELGEAGFLVPQFVDPLALPLLSWLALFVQALAIGVGLTLVVRALAVRAPVPTDRTGPFFEAVALASVVGLATALRQLWSDLVPPGLWVDGVLGLRAAAGAGRFLLPHEAVPHYPAGTGSTRVLIFGTVIDYLRSFLLLAGDRLAAYRLSSLVPSVLIVPSAYLLGRRLGGPPTALAASFLVAVASWPMTLARWGWFQQLMTVLALLALERLAKGIAEGSRRSLALGALLAGLGCHTYLAGWLAGPGLLAWSVAELSARRRHGDVALVLAVFLATLLPLAGPYVAEPALLGGRAHDVAVNGGPLRMASQFGSNIVDYAGSLLFVADPNPRHGLSNSGRLGPVLLPLFVLGLAGMLRNETLRRVEWRGLLALAAVLVCGASLTNPVSSPNTYRIGVLGPMSCCIAGTALANLASDPSRRPWRRHLLAATIAVGVAVTELSRFALWGFPVHGNQGFLGDATAIAAFAAQVGPDRVEVDPEAVREGIAPDYVLPFLAGTPGPLAIPPLLRALPPGGRISGRSPDRWLVTSRRTAGPGHSVQLGFPPASSPELVALPPGRPPER